MTVEIKINICGDTKAIIYAFSRKEEWIKINPTVYDCLIRNANWIQTKNYEAWANFMAKVNSSDNCDNELNGSNIYLQILKKIFL